MRNTNSATQPVLLKLILTAAGFILGFIIIGIFISIMPVRGSSMNPSLNQGDRVLISTMSGIRRGDRVAVESPVEEGKMLILRVIAAEDETIEIRNKIIFINGKRFDQPWKIMLDRSSIFPMKFCYRDNMPPVKLSRKEYFLMGDNFDSSFDSRNFGKVNENRIAGKIIYRSEL